MAIFEGSRYTNTILNSVGDTKFFNARKIMDFNLDDAKIHTVIQGDTLSALAHKYYNNSQLWWVFLDANKYEVTGVFDVKPGIQLIVPSYRAIQEVLNNV